jgi:hypothetical protein
MARRQAKYGSQHQRVRRAMMRNMTAESRCWRCGHLLSESQSGKYDPIELDHAPAGYALVHRSCNRAAGAAVTNGKHAQQRAALAGQLPPCEAPPGPAAPPTGRAW